MSGILLDPEFYEDIISFLKLSGDQFMDEVKRNGDHLNNTCLQFVLIWSYEEIILSFSLSSVYSSGLCCSKAR